MAKREIERTVQPSVLDRLTDLDPRGSADPGQSYADSLHAFKIGVQRDLEWLLNTRRSASSPEMEGFDELPESLYRFGMPDITSMSNDSGDARNSLLQEVEETLHTFEPRLANISITLAEAEGEQRRRELRFIVEATLRIDPTPEHVRFDTVLHYASGQIDIDGAANA